MLREIVRVNQSNPNLNKRWFTSFNVDLFTWTHLLNGELHSFQLAYDKGSLEKVALWNENEGFSFHEVDEGTSSGKHPSSPILLPSLNANPLDIVNLINVELLAIDTVLAELIISSCETSADHTREIQAKS